MQPQTRDNGAIAQLVEQRTENPCVPGSIPGGTTKRLLTFRNPLELEIVQGVFFYPRYAFITYYPLVS